MSDPNAMLDVGILGVSEAVERSFPGLRVRWFHQKQELIDVVGRQGALVVLLGPLVSSPDVAEIARACEAGAGSTRCIVSGAGNVESLQGLIDEDRVWYVSRGALAPGDVASLVTAALGRSISNPLWLGDHPTPDTLLRMLGRLMATSAPRSAGLETATAVESAAGGSASRFFWCRSDGQSLESFVDGNQRIDSAAVGIVAYAVHTGATVVVEDVGRDPRCDADLDNLLGDTHARLVVVPVHGLYGQSLGAVAVTRHTHEPVFTAQHIAAAETVVRCASAALSAVLQRHVLETRLAQEVTAASTDAAPYREEALTHHREGQLETQLLVSTYPRWLTWALRTAMAGFVALVVAATVVQLPEYVSAPAVIRVAATEHTGAPVAARNGDDYEVVAFVPKASSGSLRQGLSMEVRPSGSTAVYRLTVAELGPIFLAPGDLRRHGAGSVPISGPVLAVRSPWPAHLGSPPTDAWLADGVAADARIETGSHSVLANLVPALRRFETN